MVTSAQDARSPGGDLAFSNTPIPRRLLNMVFKYGGLMLLDAFALILIYAFFFDGVSGLAITIAFITIMANIFVLVPALYPFKWMTPGLMLATLLVIYPIIFTVQTAFTNYGDGNLLVKERVIDLIGSRGYLPDTATTYQWVPFRRGESEYALWLVDSSGQTVFVLPGEQPIEIEKTDLGYNEAQPPRYILNVARLRVTDTRTNTTYNDIAVYSDGTQFGFWIPKDNGATILYAFPGLPIEEKPFRAQGQRIRSLGNGLDIIFADNNIPTAIGAFTRIENPSDFAEALSSIVLGVEDGDQLSAANPNTLPPQIDGYTILENWDALAGIESLTYGSPLNTVVFQKIDLGIRYIYDPEQALVNDQQNSGTGTTGYFDVTVYSNGSEYALWMISTTLRDEPNPSQALLAMPNQPVRLLDLKRDRGNYKTTSAFERDYGVAIDITNGLNGRPRRIGDFTPTTDLPTDTSFIWGGETGDKLEIGTVNTSERFVVDLDQGIGIDREYGFVFRSIAFYVADDDPNSFAIWLGDGNNPKRPATGNAQFAAYIGIPNRSTLVNSPSRNRPSGFIPAEYAGFTQLITDRDRTAATTFLQNVRFDYFGIEGDTLGVKDTNTVGRPYLLRYQYDATSQTFTDLQTNQRYVADDVCDFPEFTNPEGNIERANEPICGFFKLENSTQTFLTNKQCLDSGECLSPGYRVNVGTFNFTRLVTDPGLRGPLIDIFVWTVVFAAGSVLSTFSLGLFMALILNDPVIPARKLIRSLLIIPYCIPGVISILVWQGMMNQNFGIINNFLSWLTNSNVTINWLSDAIISKFAILLVNLWLGYPYMMLISSGALQAIPSEVYEAAAVDGANPQQRFWRITLPLLLVTLGPLLIGSFVFNFNNYLLIAALTDGRPPIEGSPVPAGYTDILISYTYRLAFGNTAGADYGYASAITIVIFFIVAIVTLIQYRYTRTWEQVGENV